MKRESFIKRNVGKLKNHFAKKKAQTMEQKIQQMSDDELAKQIKELTSELQQLKRSLNQFYKTISTMSPLRVMDSYYPSQMEGFGRSHDIWQFSDYDISKEIKNCEQYLSALNLEQERRQKSNASSMQ